jgi:hypothetical protein
MTVQSVLLATLFSAAVGIFFGIYHANRAASLEPVEALTRLRRLIHHVHQPSSENNNAACEKQLTGGAMIEGKNSLRDHAEQARQEQDHHARIKIDLKSSSCSIFAAWLSTFSALAL